MPENLEEFIAYYLDRLEGPNAENAFHSLIEAPKEAVPLLVEAWNNETSSSRRAIILDIICQFRDPTTVSFLTNALRDDSEKIWKQALDGLVTIGGNTVLEILNKEKINLTGTCKKTGWIDDAIDQIRQSSA